MFALPFRHAGIAVSLAAAALACGAFSNLPTVESPVVVARATLVDQTGARVGTAEFREDRAGAAHVHIHTTGACSGAGFVDAGGHFNPSAAHHGLSSAAGPHAGDLSNIDVLSNGVGRFRGMTSRVTLRPSATSLLDADGSALVMHAGQDDQLTDPTGNSGARIACGTIVREG
jgi:superoxide dismutase, Cu-Zn family